MTIDNGIILREGDKVIAINNMAPRTVEEAVTIIRDAGKHIQVEVVSEADRLQAGQSKPPSDSGSSHHRPSPYVRTSPASLRPPGPSGHSDIRRGQVISPGMGVFYKSYLCFEISNIYLNVSVLCKRSRTILHKQQ